jgi:hypothetical protein
MALGQIIARDLTYLGTGAIHAGFVSTTFERTDSKKASIKRAAKSHNQQ